MLVGEPLFTGTYGVGETGPPGFVGDIDLDGVLEELVDTASLVCDADTDALAVLEVVSVIELLRDSDCDTVIDDVPVFDEEIDRDEVGDGAADSD